MSANPYTSRILELSTEIKNIQNIDDFVAKHKLNSNAYINRAKKISKICGSLVEIAIIQENDIITDFAIAPNACALGQASSAILSKNLIGATKQEVKLARDALFKMLKENGEYPEGRFWELRYLEGVIEYRPRHNSVLLAFDAAVAALE